MKKPEFKMHIIMAAIYIVVLVAAVVASAVMYATEKFKLPLFVLCLVVVGLFTLPYLLILAFSALKHNIVLRSAKDKQPLNGIINDVEKLSFGNLKFLLARFVIIRGGKTYRTQYIYYPNDISAGYENASVQFFADKNMKAYIKDFS